jgi:LPS-assembly lipoprotein
MSWSRRSLLLSPLALGACGFHPLYSEETAAVDEPALAAIRVLPIPDRLGQELELSLREALNPHGERTKTLYNLVTTLAQTRADLGIQRDASSTRGRVDVRVTITLTDAKSSKVIYTGHAQSTSSFNILTDGYAAQISEDDARTRTVRDLTVEIRTRLTLVLRNQKKKSA